jgi:hypothetical protein
VSQLFLSSLHKSAAMSISGVQLRRSIAKMQLRPVCAGGNNGGGRNLGQAWRGRSQQQKCIAFYLESGANRFNPVCTRPIRDHFYREQPWPQRNGVLIEFVLECLSVFPAAQPPANIISR